MATPSNELQPTADSEKLWIQREEARLRRYGLEDSSSSIVDLLDDLSSSESEDDDELDSDAEIDLESFDDVVPAKKDKPVSPRAEDLPAASATSTTVPAESEPEDDDDLPMPPKEEDALLPGGARMSMGRWRPRKDSAQIFGLKEELFKLELVLPDGSIHAFVIPARYTVDQVKVTFTFFCIPHGHI